MLTDPNENATTPDPFSISNGFLIIQAYQDPTINNHWRSGLLSSADYQGNGFSQALGYWECRFLLRWRRRGQHSDTRFSVRAVVRNGGLCSWWRVAS
jgi:hypothetical protein